MNKAVFFDRDGTLIKDQNYLSEPAKIVLEPNVIEALKILQDQNYKLIIITNQSGIARGYFSLEDFWAVQNRLLEIFTKNGIKFTGSYYCPHHPEGKIALYTKICSCRKPAPGMILKAIKEHKIDPALSFMIGDKLDDVTAGARAQVKTIFLTKNFDSKSSTIKPDYYTENLLDAVKNYIIKK